MAADSAEKLSSRVFRGLFAILALGFAGASAFHAMAMAFPSISEPSPAWRHGLFVVINALLALGLWKRPRWLVYPFGVLLLQQLYSHGSYALSLWREQGRVDWASIVVLFAVPLVFAILLRDRSRSRTL